MKVHVRLYEKFHFRKRILPLEIKILPGSFLIGVLRLSSVEITAFDEDYTKSESLVGFIRSLMFMGSKTCESDANRLRT